MGKNQFFCHSDLVTPLINTRNHFYLFYWSKIRRLGCISGVSSRKSPGQPKLIPKMEKEVLRYHHLCIKLRFALLKCVLVDLGVFEGELWLQSRSAGWVNFALIPQLTSET